MNRVMVLLMPISISLALFVLLITLTAFPNVVLAQSSQQPAIGSSSKGSSAAPSNLNSAKLLNRLEKIPSLSNIVGVSMINGIQVSGINVGDTDLSVTLRRQITTDTTTTTTGTKNTTSNISSLPVTVIAAKLPITNLTELISTLEATHSLAMATSSGANPMDDVTGQLGLSNTTAIQGNAFQILSLLKNIQIGAGSIVNANWTLPQTVSMGFLGLGNRIAASAPSDFVLVVVVPFQGESDIPTLRLG